MFIGMTEAGDAGWDLSWHDKVLKSNECYGAILITKTFTRPEFQEKALDLIQRKPCIIHAGVTGWGHTDMEPGNKEPEEAMQNLRQFIDAGFPASNVVLRIDPIFPTQEGIARAINVLSLRQTYCPDVKRIRISIYDDYHRSREEICRRGYEPIDNITKWKNEQERRPTLAQVDLIARNLIANAPTQIFECCAEPEIAARYPEHFIWTGCLSQTDCDLMNIKVPAHTGINGQNRFGCRCLTLKKELLNNKKRCPNNCAYCYWGRS